MTNKCQKLFFFLRGQNEKMLTKIFNGYKDKETQQEYANNRQFFQKILSQFTKHFVISDSTYKFVKQDDKISETAIHSYPSAAICDANDILDWYSNGTKPECLVFPLGHNAINQATDRKRPLSKWMTSSVISYLNSNPMMLLYAKFP